VIYGYSLAFSEGGTYNVFVGGLSKAFLASISELTIGIGLRERDPP
jgi:Amt family ammonium transporter